MRHTPHRHLNPAASRIWLRLLLPIIMAGSISASPVLKSAALVSPSLHLLHADATGLDLEWIAPPVQTRLAQDGTLRIEAAGYSQTQQPGAPRLPFTSTLIALPPAASPPARPVHRRNDQTAPGSPCHRSPSGRRDPGIARPSRGRGPRRRRSRSRRLALCCGNDGTRGRDARRAPGPADLLPRHP
jgi:hypothetical protein